MKHILLLITISCSLRAMEKSGVPEELGRTLLGVYAQFGARLRQRQEQIDYKNPLIIENEDFRAEYLDAKLTVLNVKTNQILRDIDTGSQCSQNCSKISFVANGLTLDMKDGSACHFAILDSTETSSRWCTVL